MYVCRAQQIALAVEPIVKCFLMNPLSSGTTLCSVLSKLAIAEILRVSKNKKTKKVENPGIDPGTSHMLSERSTI